MRNALYKRDWISLAKGAAIAAGGGILTFVSLAIAPLEYSNNIVHIILFIMFST